MKLITPYNWYETLGWLWRNYLTGPKRSNETSAVFLPSSQVLNDIIPRLRIAFIGDIMKHRGRRLIVDPAVSRFLSDCDFLVGNFEGTLTNGPQEVYYDQVHEPEIMDSLAELFPPEKTFLSVANNHTADFGEKACRESVAQLRERGFQVFGMADSPMTDPCPEVRLIAWTWWSNRPSPFLPVCFKPETHLCRTGAFNIFCPHWGYELEWFPRRKMAVLGQQLLANCDAVIGHHSHTPQPITSFTDNARVLRKLLVYSLGDFCFYGRRFDFYRWGLIAKLEIGPTPTGPWAAGRVDWRFTCCIADAPDELLVTISDCPPISEFDKQ